MTCARHDHDNPHCSACLTAQPYAYKGGMTLDEIAAAERHVGAHAVYVAPNGPYALHVTGQVLKTPKHSHYFKPCPFDSVDVYRVLALFNVSDPCLQHAVKKLLVAGGRGGGKDISRDIQEAIDTLTRWQEMRAEETPA